MNNINNQPSDSANLFRRKFEMFKKLTDQSGEEMAWEKMLEGYPERQKRQMGAFIDSATLASGLQRAIPNFRQMGMEMEVIDMSVGAVDAALEVQRKCPVLGLYAEYGLARPCHVICEMDVEATRRAFPDIRGDILCTQADGACVCVFKYERKRSSPAKTQDPVS